MPNKANAKKALRQDAKRYGRNKLAKAELKSLRIKFRKTITAKKLDEAAELAKTISKKLDKMQARGVLKKNTVARNKSRIMSKLNLAKA